MIDLTYLNYTLKIIASIICVHVLSLVSKDRLLSCNLSYCVVSILLPVPKLSGFTFFSITFSDQQHGVEVCDFGCHVNCACFMVVI